MLWSSVYKEIKDDNFWLTTRFPWIGDCFQLMSATESQSDCIKDLNAVWITTFKVIYLALCVCVSTNIGLQFLINETQWISCVWSDVTLAECCIFSVYSALQMYFFFFKQADCISAFSREVVVSDIDSAGAVEGDSSGDGIDNLDLLQYLNRVKLSVCVCTKLNLPLPSCASPLNSHLPSVLKLVFLQFSLIYRVEFLPNGSVSRSRLCEGCQFIIVCLYVVW